MKTARWCISTAPLLLLFSASSLVAQDPFAQIISSDTIAWYNVAPLTVMLRLGPTGARVHATGGELTKNYFPSAYVLTITNLTGEGIMPIVATSSIKGKTERDEKYVRLIKPEMSYDVKRWQGARAVVGSSYDPSSDWASKDFPENHYQTLVWFDDKVMLNLPGTDFRFLSPEGKDAMRVKESTRSIKTTVYWKPGGTLLMEQWRALLSTDPDYPNVIKAPTVQISYPAPEHISGFEFNWHVSSTSTTFNSQDQIMLAQQVGPNRYAVQQPTVMPCDECPRYGISATLRPGIDSLTWQLEARIDTSVSKAWRRELRGKRFDIPIEVKGRGGTTTAANVALYLTAYPFPVEDEDGVDSPHAGW